MNYSVAYLILVLTVARPGYAQFRLDVEQLAEGETPAVDLKQDENKSNVAKPNRPRIARRFLAVNNLDEILVSDAKSTAQIIARRQRQLHTTVARLQIELQLTATQSERLLLAGLRDLASITEIADSISKQAQDESPIEDIMQQVQVMHQKLRAGFSAETSMMAKITERVLASESNGEQPSAETERTIFAYRSAMRLIVTQVDLVAPLTTEQWEAFETCIRNADLPDQMPNEMIYAFALKHLLLDDNAPKILRPNQMSHLKVMRRGVMLGSIRPHAFTKRQSVTDAFRIERTP